MSQTVGGLPIDPTTKKPQLGTISDCLGGGKCARCLALAHDVEHLIC